MTYRILGSLAATSLSAVLQIPQLSCAQDVGTKIIEPPSILFCQPHLLATHGSLEADTSNILEADTSISEADTSISEADTSNINEAYAEPTDLDSWLTPSAGRISIFSHSRAGHQAATIYIRSIPLMTFIGAEQPVADASKTLTSPDAPITDPDLMARVIATATQLDAFSQAGGNAEHIGVRWDADREVFIIALAGQDLVIINETAIFPNTFQDPAVDALQVANRLRYLLGEAPPLATIEELPEPEPAPAPAEVAPRIAMVLTGVASWYGPGFHGRRSASGEVFNQQAMTAAHRHLPFGTLVRVTNLNNGRQVIVRINDRGPFIHGRTIDVSAGAAATLGMTYSGIARVRLEVLED